MVKQIVAWEAEDGTKFHTKKEALTHDAWGEMRLLCKNCRVGDTQLIMAFLDAHQSEIFSILRTLLIDIPRESPSDE